MKHIFDCLPEFVREMVIAPPVERTDIPTREELLAQMTPEIQAKALKK